MRATIESAKGNEELNVPAETSEQPKGMAYLWVSHSILHLGAFAQFRDGGSRSRPRRFQPRVNQTPAAVYAVTESSKPTNTKLYEYEVLFM